MAKKKAPEEEEMVPVGPGVDGQEEEDEDQDEFPEAKGDDDEGEEPRKRPKKKRVKDEEEDEDGDDSDEDDERVGHGEDDEEEDEDGRSKRESRKARRERQRRARQRNEVELNFLREQNERLEKRIREIGSRVERSEVGSIDQRITQIQSQLKVADQVLAKAHENGSGEDVVEATNIRDKLKDTLGKLSGVREEMRRRTESSSEEPEVDSRLIYHAQNWMRRNSWYDPKGADRDSRAVAAIDNQLSQEGFNPSSQEYWDELDERVREKLPHKFKTRRNGRDHDDDDLEEEEEPRNKRRGSGPRFSTGGRERPLRKNEVYVSPERKQAMVDAGVWDDKVLRNKYLKRYAEWDRENPRGRAAR